MNTPFNRIAPDFTIADVLAWARTKPADEAYDFCKSSQCAVAQFGIATGRPELVHVSDLRDIPVVGAALWKAAITSFDGKWSDYSSTFGGFAKRLEQQLPAPVIRGIWTHPDAYLTDLETVEA